MESSSTHSPNDVRLIHSVEVAVVDDSHDVSTLISRFLRDIGCAVRIFHNPVECLESLRKAPADILIVDLKMPEMDGLDLLRQVKEEHEGTEAIVVTGFADKDAAVDALRAGAFDFFEKPVERDELVETVKRTVRYSSALRERNKFEKQVSFLSHREAEQWGIDAFIGRSAAVRSVLGDVRVLQNAPRTSVLITGESGTGKELVARAIHFGSPRASRPWIPVNCAAVPEELAESVLFGHVRGAFTGAAADRQGSFQLADGGTIFLDEISAMPLSLQPKLLRVLEDGKVIPVGAGVGKEVDVRLIAAANEDLNSNVQSGKFRPDLYHRLAVFTITLPSLRDRKEDIPLLAAHFVEKLSEEMGLKTCTLSESACGELSSHDYPGNVRELRNVIERALIVSGGGVIKPEHLSFSQSHLGQAKGPVAAAKRKTDYEDLPLNLKEAEAELIKKAMARTDGNVSRAAKMLGINRTKLYRRLAALSYEYRPDS